MTPDSGHERLGAVVTDGDGPDDLLALHLVPQREHRFELRLKTVGAGVVGLVDHENVRDLQDAGLDRLDIVAHPRDENDKNGIGRANDINLVLTHTDRLDDDDVVTGGIEQIDGVGGRARQTTKGAARRHRADEDSRVDRVPHHPDAVAENRPPRKG